MSTNQTTVQKKRVVILGSSPLPFENTKKTYASGIRTWHFTLAAKEANCDVMIIGYRIPSAYVEELPEIKFMQVDGIDYYNVDGPIFENKDWLLEKINAFNPDCIIGVNTHPSSVVAKLNLPIPFWADLNGSVMAEAQAKAYVYDDDKYLNHFFKMESQALSKADIFSTVSEAQGFSLIGELGVWGRLNKNSMGYRMVRVIPNTVDSKKLEHTKNVIRGQLVHDSEFVVLYSGGYNTWTDVDTLFHGLEKAMEKNPKLIFVSTGGEIFGHDELTYEHFKELILKSKFKDRFHLCGWVPSNDLPNYYLEADLGINSDKFSYEAILGARTRVLDWLRVPMTFISTPLSEVTNYLIQNQLAFGFREGDPDDLAEKLVQISSNPKELEKIKSKLKKIVSEEFTSKYTFREFREWVKNPIHSPDHNKMVELVSNSSENPLPKVKSGPALERMAFSSWPKIFSILQFLHLSKHEKKIKKFGAKVAIREKLPIYRANFIDVDLPEMKQEGKYIIPIVVKNIGNVEWKNHLESINAVNFSYIWKDKDGNVILKNEERTPLPLSVKSGKKIKLDVMVTAPQEPGEYILEIDLLKEKEFWFSEVNSQPFTSSVNVKKNKQITAELPKASVIVVGYNSEKYISECIDSILDSEYPDLEILVVDNASKDKTVEILRKYGDKIKLFQSKDNLGFAGGNNLGIKNSKGDVIIMINPDAFVTKNYLKNMILPLVQDEKTMVSGPKIFYPGTKKIQSAGGMVRKNAIPYHLGYGKEDSSEFDYPREVDYVTGAAIAIKRKLFELTGLFDTLFSPVYYEETDKCFRARKLGYKVMYAPQSIVYHYESTTLTALSENFLIHFHTSRFKYIYKNYNFSEFLSFVSHELRWFLFCCGSKEKRIVVKAHLNSLFSPKIRFRKKISID